MARFLVAVAFPLLLVFLIGMMLGISSQLAEINRRLDTLEHREGYDIRFYSPP